MSFAGSVAVVLIGGLKTGNQYDDSYSSRDSCLQGLDKEVKSFDVAIHWVLSLGKPFWSCFYGLGLRRPPSP